MKPGDMLFVYGTLLRGESADLSKKPGAVFVREDMIRGRLYNLGWYPGMKPGDGNIHGEVFILEDESIIKRMDGYEGYPHLYDRSVVETATGLNVWVYTYNGGVSEDSRIVSGDWVHRDEPLSVNPPQGME